MRAAFGRIGYDNATRIIISNQGITDMDSLRLLTSKDIDEMIKGLQRTQTADGATYPFIATKKLKAFRFWAELCKRTGDSDDPVLFTDAVCTHTLNRIKEEEDMVKSDTASRPEAITSLKSWRIWWESFDNYMAQTRGAARISLKYVYREHEEVTNDHRGATYASVDERLEACTKLQGDYYRIDNERVFKELKALLLAGPLFTYVRKFDATSNGRKAVLALKLQMDGETSLVTRKTRAYNDIATAAYRGERSGWTFAQYVAKHQTAHNELEQCEEPVAETKKVTDFLQGITDPTLLVGKGVVMGDSDKLGSFEKCQQYLSTFTTNTLTHAARNRRGVAEVNQNSNRSGGKGNKQSGKSGKGHFQKTKGKVTARNYTSDEWKALSQEQRDQIRKLRKKQSSENAEKRKAAAAHQGASDDEMDDDTPPNNNHGNQFGRNGNGKNRGGDKE